MTLNSSDLTKVGETMKLGKNTEREKQRAFYQQNQLNQNTPLQQLNNINTKKPKKRDGPSSRWTYRGPAIGVPLVVWLMIVIAVQYLAAMLHNMSHKNAQVGMFTSFGLGGIYTLLFLFGVPIFGGWLWYKLKQSWENKNAIYMDDETFTHFSNDAYIRTMDNLTQELDAAPDAGLGFDGHASTLMGHAMISNKGIHKIEMPQYDPNVDGFVKRDANGNIVKKLVPMFNPEFADTLFSMTGVPQEYRTLYDATDYDFNRKLKSGGRAGAYGRKEYDKLSDYINNEFYALDTDTERPAGIYFYDSRPVNTILIAITRAGKGQTYIEPALDVWTREKKKWNIFTTDPKGGASRFIVKSYNLAIC